MTHSNETGPKSAPGAPAPKSSAAPSPVQAPAAVAVRPPAKQSDAERIDSMGSRSPGALPGEHVRDNRPTTYPTGADAAARSPGAPSSIAPVVASPKSGKPDTVSPQDPKPFGTDDPVQPKRPSADHPSTVAAPTTGATALDGRPDGECS